MSATTGHDVPRDDEDRAGENEAETAVLNCMLCEDRSYPWTVDEIARELGAATVDDAVGSLARAGLLHRCGEFVFPTRAARRADELQLGTL